MKSEIEWKITMIIDKMMHRIENNPLKKESYEQNNEGQYALCPFRPAFLKMLKDMSFIFKNATYF